MIQITDLACRKGEDTAQRIGHISAMTTLLDELRREMAIFRLRFMVGGGDPLKMVCAGKTQRKLGFL